MKSYVYYIVNKMNGKRYVGKSNSPEWRFKGHLGDAAKGSMLKFHCAIRKHGAENFELHVHSEHDSEELAFEAETKTIREWNTVVNGYNMNEGGVGGVNPSEDVKENLRRKSTGRHHTDETKQKMSKAKRGKSHAPHSEKTKQKMRETRKCMRDEGRDKHTDETRQKMSDAWKNNPDRKPWNKGKHTERFNYPVRHRGDALRGIEKTEEHKRNLRKSLQNPQTKLIKHFISVKLIKLRKLAMRIMLVCDIHSYKATVSLGMSYARKKT